MSTPPTPLKRAPTQTGNEKLKRTKMVGLLRLPDDDSDEASATPTEVPVVVREPTEKINPYLNPRAPTTTPPASTSQRNSVPTLTTAQPQRNSFATPMTPQRNLFPTPMTPRDPFTTSTTLQRKSIPPSMTPQPKSISTVTPAKGNSNLKNADNYESEDDSSLLSDEPLQVTMLDENEWACELYVRPGKSFTGEKMVKLVTNVEMWTNEITTVKATTTYLGRDVVEIDEEAEYGDEMVGYGYGFEGVHDKTVSSRLNPITSQVFGAAMKLMAVPQLHGAHDLCWLDESGMLQQSRTAMSFIGTVMPMVNNQPSFENQNGLELSDPRYWLDHVSHRMSGTTRIHFSELALQIYDVFLSERDKTKHSSAIIAGAGPFVGLHGYIMFTAFEKYAFIISQLMSQPIVRQAMKMRWRPCILFKNLICQRNYFGVNGFRVATVNQTTKTFVALVGFHRQMSTQKDDFECIGLLNSGSPLSMSNDSFVRLGS